MAELEELTFHWADYLVFGAIMLVCILIGLVQGVRDRWGLKKKDDGNAPGQEKDMKLVPVIWSIVATSFSSNFILGFPAEIYYLGTEFGVVCIGFAIGFPTAIYLFVKKFYELGIPSVFDYIGMRFGGELKAMMTVLYALAMILYMGLIIYAPALAFGGSSALPIWAAVLLAGLICIIYTTMGGLKGVLWIDTLQMIIVLAIGLSNCAYGTYKVGGISTVWEVATNGSRIEWTSWSADPTIRHSFWSCTVGGTAVIWLLATNQAVTQKFLGLPNMKEVYIAGGCYCLAVEVFCCVYMMSGVVIYAYYRVVSCEPTIAGITARADELVPYFILDIYRDAPGVAGLFTAAVFGASLSTVSAGINALAAVTLRDIVFPIYKKKGGLPDAKRRVILFKGLSVLWGAIALGIAFVAPLLGRSVLQIGLSILSMASGPIVGVLILGMYFPFSEKIGAFCGVILAIIVEFALLIGSTIYPTDPVLKPLQPGVCVAPNVTEYMTSSTTAVTTTLMSSSTPEPEESDEVSEFFKVSYLLYAPFGILITIVVGLIVSIFARWCNGHIMWPEVEDKLLHLPHRVRHGAHVSDITSKGVIAENGKLSREHSPKADQRKLAKIDEEKPKDPLEAALRQTSDLPVAASLAFAHEYQNKGFEPDATSRM